MPVLDTSFLIDLERGLPAAEAALQAMADGAEAILLPAQVAVEYLSGLEDQLVALHMLESSFVVLDFTREHVLQAARIARDALLAGVFPAWADVQVAAAAKLEAMPVATANVAHFRALGCDVLAYRG